MDSKRAVRHSAVATSLGGVALGGFSWSRASAAETRIAAFGDQRMRNVSEHSKQTNGHRHVETLEKNGFTLFDVTPDHIEVRQTSWRRPEPIEAIGSLKPSATSGSNVVHNGDDSPDRAQVPRRHQRSAKRRKVEVDPAKKENKMRHLITAAILAIAAPAIAQEVKVEDVTFLSRDGKTQVKGYLFKSADAPAKIPAVVMMHGGAGAYSSLANGKYDATTLSSRHKAWGELLARNGYAALMVDDFGAVGFPAGFAAGTNAHRPAAIDEVDFRPLHAYGALRFLQSRPDIAANRIALLGWSHGASATLAAMADDKPGDMRKIGFTAGVVLYPNCVLKKRFEKDGYKPYNPVRVFVGTADEKVSPKLCQSFVDRSKLAGNDISLRMFDGATHSYDTPLKSRQSVLANATAKAATEADVLEFLASILEN